MRLFTWIVIAYLCAAAPAAAHALTVIISADSLGPTIGTPDDFRNARGPSAQLDSVLLTWDRLVDQLPLTDIGSDIVSLTQSEQWTIILALEQYWPTDEPYFTNVDPSEPRCPRTFISADFLLNPAISDCRKQAILCHEWRHARDFVDGLAPPLFFGDVQPTTLAEQYDVFLVERRGFLVQMAAMNCGGCISEDRFGQAYNYRGRLGLEEEICRVYQLPAIWSTRWRALLTTHWPPLPRTTPQQ